MLEATRPTTNQDINPLYSQAQLAWLNRAKRFADAIPLQDVLASDRDNVFRRDLLEAACQEGFGALPFGKQFGGAEGDYVGFCLVNEEFAKRCVPIMSSLGVHVLCQEPIYRFGTEEQKVKYLKLAAQGKSFGAFALTEPAAGSDTAAIETSARLKGNDYLLNGTKTFITTGGAADFYIVMARLNDLDPSEDEPYGITAFIVDRDCEGLSFGQKFEMMGMRGCGTCELIFNDCRVPRANLLGEKGAGRKVALSSLAKGRVTIAAQATGWAQGALEGAIRALRSQQVIKSDKSSTRGPGNFTALETTIGEMLVQIEAARALTYQAAMSIDLGENDITLASMAKLKATDVAMKVSSDAISLVGEAGLAPELLLERIFRDAKAGQIYEGTNQIQRILIARNLIKTAKND
jgi:alkylation response protein AidB-like acyl-CoA dehydrogenase